MADSYQPDQVSVLIAHLAERDRLLAEALAGYEREGVLEVLVRTGLSAGAAYNDLAQSAGGTVLLFAADDQVPHPGAITAGLATLAGGAVPFSRLYSVEGGVPAPGYDDAAAGVELDYTRAPLITAAMFAQVGPFLDLSWYIDNDYSARLLAAGYRIRSCPGFAFTHLHGDQSWLGGGERERQEAEYLRARRGPL